MRSWNVVAIDIYARPELRNIVRALVNILSLRGVPARDAGPRRMQPDPARSGRRLPHALYIDPNETHLTRSGSVRVPTDTPYFVYLTRPLACNASGDLEIGGLDAVLRGALCVYDVSDPNLALHPAGCVSRVLPLPMVPPLSARLDQDTDIVFIGNPDEKQGGVLEALEEKWRVRRLGNTHGSELSAWLAKARTIVLPLSAGYRSLPHRKLAESLLTRAHVIAELPPGGRPALYDERIVFVPGSSHVAEEFCTAVTAAMLGKQGTRSRDEIGRLERALYQATRESLEGIGRAGPSPEFLGSVIRWVGCESMAETLQHLSTAPDIWRALETRTLAPLMRGVPSINLAEAEDVEVACLCTGDAEGTMAGLLSGRAAFPQYVHTVYCASSIREKIASELHGWSLDDVGLVSDPAWGDEPDWEKVLLSPAFWKAQKSEYILAVSDTLLLKTADLSRFAHYDLVRAHIGDGSILMLARSASMVQSCEPPVPKARTRTLDPTLPSPPTEILRAPEAEGEELAAALFPSLTSIIAPPATAGPRLPGMQVAFLDSFHRLGDMEVGAWESNVALNLLAVHGVEIDVYSALDDTLWSSSLLEAWGASRSLRGMRLHPLDAFRDVGVGQYTLVVELVANKEASLTRRLAEHQWLCCLDPGSPDRPWRDPGAFAHSFDRVLVGSMGAYHRYLACARGVVPESSISVVPIPAYDMTGRAPVDGKKDMRAVALLGSSAHAGTIVSAYRAYGADEQLTVIMTQDDPAAVAEVQALLLQNDPIVVVGAATSLERQKHMRPGSLAILDPNPYEWAAGAGMPQWAIEAVDRGCIPVFSRDCALAVGAFVEGVHGAAFSSAEELSSVFSQHRTGGHVMMEEGSEELVGMSAVHTPSAHRQALISTILGGRGILDTGLVRSSPFEPPPPAAEVRVHSGRMPLVSEHEPAAAPQAGRRRRAARSGSQMFFG